MKRIPIFFNLRRDLDGWAVRVKGAPNPILSTLCTTKAEADELRRSMHRPEVLEVVPVAVHLEVLDTNHSKGNRYV